MSKKIVEFKLDLKGLNELMMSPEMQAALEEAGRAVANSAGDEFDSSVHTASFVAIANVYPNSKKAARQNHKENTLLKAISAAGLSMTKGG